MNKSTRIMIGAALALAATCAAADTYTYGETGSVADDNGRLYTYVFYGTHDDATPIVTSDAADVNADSRGSTPVQPLPIEAQSAHDDTIDNPTVAIGTPDVNEVKGRA